MPGIRLLHFMRAAMDLLPAWCSQTAMQVTVRLYGDESPSILGLLLDDPPGSPQPALASVEDQSSFHSRGVRETLTHHRRELRWTRSAH